MQKQYRLKRIAAFAYVYRKGTRTSARNLVLLDARSREGLKIGLSVSKKVGNAVTRNRVKRLLREAIRPLMSQMDAKRMYVFVARPSIVGLSLNEIESEVRAALTSAGRLQ